MNTTSTDDPQSPVAKNFYTVELSSNDRFGTCIKHSSGLKM